MAFREWLHAAGRRAWVWLRGRSLGSAINHLRVGWERPAVNLQQPRVSSRYFLHEERFFCTAICFPSTTPPRCAVEATIFVLGSQYSLASSCAQSGRPGAYLSNDIAVSSRMDFKHLIQRCRPPPRPACIAWNSGPRGRDFASQFGVRNQRPWGGFGTPGGSFADTLISCSAQLKISSVDGRTP